MTSKDQDMSQDFKHRVHDRDFIVNSIWEGTGDELHYNDIYARKTEFGGRVLSGLALTCLASAHHSAATKWSPPGRLDLSFDSVVLANDEIGIRQSGTPAETSIDVMVGDRRVLKMVFTPEENVPPAPSTPSRVSKGRTLTVGDREVFDWWLSSSLPSLQLAKPGIVPWPWSPRRYRAPSVGSVWCNNRTRPWSIVRTAGDFTGTDESVRRFMRKYTTLRSA